VTDDMQSLAQVKQELGEKIDAVHRTVDQTRARLEGKIDQTRARLEGKIDAVDRKVDQTRAQLEGKIDAVDRKVDQTRAQLEGKIDAVDHKVDQTRAQLEGKIDLTRSELSTLVTATATALERRIDRKLDEKLARQCDQLEGRLVKAADHAVERVLGTVYERFRYDAGALDDRIDAQKRELDRHIANERIHHTHGDEPR
jgi:tRNA U34 5-carboxymethylaminomethyl modifying GTPase MnmE/TrmE